MLICTQQKFPSDQPSRYQTELLSNSEQPPAAECDVRNVAEAETEAGAGGEGGAMTAAQMLRLLRRLQPGPGARQLKWGFW